MRLGSYLAQGTAEVITALLLPVLWRSHCHTSVPDDAKRSYARRQANALADTAGAPHHHARLLPLAGALRAS